MDAEIISIGDELSSGQRLDTNSQWIAQQLSDLGIRALFHTTIADDLAANIEAFQIASRRVDIVVCTGGLGPTKDDLTREAIGAAFNLPLQEYPEALQHIETLFRNRQRPMPERNKVQALFPESSHIIPNPHGTAPGIDLVINDCGSDQKQSCRIFALPGVPAEMKEMWQQTVARRLIDQCGAGKRRIRYCTLKCFGIGESEVEVRMPDLISRDRIPRVGITASRATITLRIAAEGATEEECRLQIEPTRQEILERLGQLVFAEGDDELPETVIKKLTHRKQTLGIIEFGATALLGQWLSNAQEKIRQRLNQETLAAGGNSSQNSDHRSYVGALHTTTLNDLVRLVQTTLEPIEVSLQKLAVKVGSSLNCDWILAVGPYPQLDDAAATNPIPYANEGQKLPAGLATHQVEIVVLGPTEIISSFASLSGHPDVVQHRIAKTALDKLRYSLLSESSSSAGGGVPTSDQSRR